MKKAVLSVVSKQNKANKKAAKNFKKSLVA
jgi:hypothetical protein